MRHQLPSGGGGHPLRFSVWFKISYRVIQRLNQHIFLNKISYLHVDVTYVIANRNYEFLNTGTLSHYLTGLGAPIFALIKQRQGSLLSSERARDELTPSQVIPGATRVDTIRVLGVALSSNLQMDIH